MKDNGFTLIELLAVIVILAILALIVTPIILNIIGDTKESSVVRSGEIYLSAVEQAIARANLNKEFNPTSCEIQSDGNLICGEQNLVVETTGSRPVYGTILLQDGKISKITNLELDNYILKKDINSNLMIDRRADELKPQGTYLTKASSLFTNGNITREEVESIVIKNKKSVPGDAIISWDVSEAQDGSIMAWYTDINNNGLYEVYIGGDGGVKANKNSSWLFANLPKTILLDLKYLDTSDVTNMYALFYHCYSLKSINISSFNTSKVTNMYGMFSTCKNLEKIDISSFDTTSVTTMQYMFYHCESVTKLELSNFDTSKVLNIESMFEGCYKLTALDLNNFNTNKVTTMGAMFSYCRNLQTINISNFNTSSVKLMDRMFEGCTKLVTLDLSNFDTSQVTNMTKMFNSSTSLTTLNLSKANFTNVASYENMLGISDSATILVKDEASKNFIEQRLADVNKQGVNVSIAS